MPGGRPVKETVVKASKILQILRVPAWRRALLGQRVAAGVEHAGALRALPMLRTIVDVGANRGQFSLAARHFFPEAEITAFEPLAGPATTWRVVFADDARASLVGVALGPVSGDALLNVSGRDDSSSLLPITAEQEGLFPGTAQVGTEAVRVARLVDHLPVAEIQVPALLKIDVQGFELQVLAGCEDVLSRFDLIYAECSFIELYEGQALADEVIAWLRHRGFLLRGIYHVVYDAGRAVQGDFLFARKATIPDSVASGR